MRVVALFQVHQDGVEALKGIIRQVAPQIALEAEIEFLEAGDEQVVRPVGHEAGPGCEELAEAAEHGAAVEGEHDGTDGRLAGAPGEDAAVEPFGRCPDAWLERSVLSEEDGPVSPSE